MKISIPKPPAASRPAEPPGKSGNTGIVPPKSGNTGIVPPKSGNTGIVPPKDSFQPTTPATGKGGTSSATGTSSASLTGATTTPADYTLAPKLEQFRHLFDAEGERISKLPVEQQAGEIELTSSRLYEQLKDFGTLEEVTVGVKASVAFYSRGSGTNDPMTYMRAADAAALPPVDGGSAQGEVSVTPFNPSPPPRDEERLPRFGGRREQQAEEDISQRFRRMRRFF
jgi:hypothetical protein